MRCRSFKQILSLVQKFANYSIILGAKADDHLRNVREVAQF